MAKHPKRKAAKLAKGFFCQTDAKPMNFNPETGKKFRRPLCVPTSGKGRPRPPHRLPKKKTVAIDCRKGFTLYTGQKRKRPTCVRAGKGGAIKTHRPFKGPKSRQQANAVQVSKVVAISGRR